MSVDLDACTDKAIGQRIREIRDERGQIPFLAALFEVTGYRLSISQLSRKENGKEGVTPCDIAAIAALDQKQRGPAWLAWGVEPKLTPRAQRETESRDPIVEKLADRLSRAEQPKDVRRKRRGR